MLASTQPAESSSLLVRDKGQERGRGSKRPFKREKMNGQHPACTILGQAGLENRTGEGGRGWGGGGPKRLLRRQRKCIGQHSACTFLKSLDVARGPRGVECCGPDSSLFLWDETRMEMP